MKTTILIMMFGLCACALDFGGDDLGEVDQESNTEALPEDRSETCRDSKTGCTRYTMYSVCHWNDSLGVDRLVCGEKRGFGHYDERDDQMAQTEWPINQIPASSAAVWLGMPRYGDAPCGTTVASKCFIQFAALTSRPWTVGCGDWCDSTRTDPEGRPDGEHCIHRTARCVGEMTNYNPPRVDRPCIEGQGEGCVIFR
jgi:hypothetical protein